MQKSKANRLVVRYADSLKGDDGMFVMIKKIIGEISAHVIKEGLMMIHTT